MSVQCLFPHTHASYLAGKVRVKIITNKDAIRRFGDQGGGMQILTEQETNQFKDMIMGLLVGVAFPHPGPLPLSKSVG